MVRGIILMDASHEDTVHPYSAVGYCTKMVHLYIQTVLIPTTHWECMPYKGKEQAKDGQRVKEQEQYKSSKYTRDNAGGVPTIATRYTLFCKLLIYKGKKNGGRHKRMGHCTSAQ